MLYNLILTENLLFEHSVSAMVQHQICMLCNNSEVPGTIQYHPSLVIGINTDIVLVQMSYMTGEHVDKKLTKLQRGPWLVGEPPPD